MLELTGNLDAVNVVAAQPAGPGGPSPRPQSPAE
jgi:hypothetical protein